MDQPALDLSPLHTAIASLCRALSLTQDERWLARQSQTMRSVLLAGILRHFESTYELCIALLRHQLALTPDPSHETDPTAFRGMLHTAQELHLIDDPETWLHYRQLHGLAAQTHDHVKACGLVPAIAGFPLHAQLLLAQLELRNG